MPSFDRLSRRNFISAAAAAAGSALVSPSLLAQDPVVNAVPKDGKIISRDKVPWKVRPFPMKQVRLGQGPCTVAMEADRKYLHSLPPDRLLHTFRINAKISSSAEPLGDGKLPIANYAGITRADIIFPPSP